MNSNPSAMLSMIQVCDSLFPVGNFTLSNGLETYVTQGLLRSPEDLEEYVHSYLDILPYNELGTLFLAYSHRDDPDTLVRLDRIATVSRAPREVRTGSQKTCRRFLKIWSQIAQFPALARYQEQVQTGRCSGCYPIAMGLYAAALDLDCSTAAGIYAYSLVNALVTNAVKCVPLSQVAGQRILYDLREALDTAVREAAQVSMDDLGVGGPGFDIAGMQHETLYSRLYMS